MVTKHVFTKEEMEDLCINQHLSGQKIANLFGMSRARIQQIRKAFGIPVGLHFSIPCDYCGNLLDITLKRFNQSAKHYCRDACYFADRAKGSLYSPHRNGQRIARAIMADHLRRDLLPEEVVHHKDGNDDNNMLRNHILFPDHSTHLKYHHALRIHGHNIVASSFGAYDPIEFHLAGKDDLRLKKSSQYFSISQDCFLSLKHTPFNSIVTDLPVSNLYGTKPY